MRFPKLKPYQIVLEVLCLGLLIAGLAYTLIKYPSLPAQIPGHYNAAGEVTDYSGKGFIWILEGMSIFTYLIMTVFLLFPKLLQNPNTTWTVNPAAKAITASETISLLGETKFECMLMFGYMLIPIMNCTPMNTWPIWGLTALMFISVTLRLVHMKKLTQLKQPWER